MKPYAALLALFCLAAGNLPAQEPAPKPAPKPDPKPGPPAVAPQPAAPKPVAQPLVTQRRLIANPAPKKSIADIIKTCDESKGLFTVYRDRENGTLYLLVKKAQLDKEFIYFSHVADGIVAAGLNRGQFQGSEVFVIRRNYEKLEFVEQNTAFYFDPRHPLARAANANVSHAVLANEPVVDEDKDSVLINAAGLFLRESFRQVRRGSDAKNPLGKLSESKTKFLRAKSYKRNTLFVVEYVYENSAPPRNDDDGKGNDDVADPRYVSVSVQHTFIAMPHNHYQPRVDDPRVGYFMTQMTDQTSTEVTPWRDFIHRWDLQKKHPAEPLSEPKKPIVWWMENTTPLEFRDTIREAGLKWNNSFEKIGFKNAVVIKQQPDDAKWDAGDIDKNVLRWTSSPKPPFGGYGPSFVNPRTGQILGSDIMLEFVFVKNRVMAQRLWSELGMANLVEKKPGAAFDQYNCMAANITQQGLLFGNQIMRLRKAGEVDMQTMIKESLTQLILHEMGHTLGLNHNFRGSQLHTPAELQDRALTERTGLSGSVMDYMPMNLGPDKQHQGQYYITNPGQYDDWAIEYGYSVADADPVKEQARLAAIAARSDEPALAFANDADDMRVPGKAIDPRAQIYDMSSDPIAYGSNRCEIARKAATKLLADYPKEGKSWQELTQAYISLTTESSNALTAISRYIGGVYVDRSFVKQVKLNPPDPLRPVEGSRQKAAMHALAKYAFAPDAWTADGALLRHLQQQRRGFDFRNEGEDPKLHERALKLQRALLDHLMHPNTQNRILDSALYGNQYPLNEVMHDLTAAIISPQELQAPVNTLRQNLQLDYVTRLLGITASGGYFYAAQSVALYELKGIQRTMKFAQDTAPESNKPHIANILYRIARGLDEKNP